MFTTSQQRLFLETKHHENIYEMFSSCRGSWHFPVNPFAFSTPLVITARTICVVKTTRKLKRLRI